MQKRTRITVLLVVALLVGLASGSALAASKKPLFKPGSYAGETSQRLPVKFKATRKSLKVTFEMDWGCTTTRDDTGETVVFTTDFRARFELPKFPNRSRGNLRGESRGKSRLFPYTSRKFDRIEPKSSGPTPPTRVKVQFVRDRAMAIANVLTAEGSEPTTEMVEDPDTGELVAVKATRTCEFTTVGDLKRKKG